jgi:hypothetical protein
MYATRIGSTRMTADMSLNSPGTFSETSPTSDSDVSMEKFGRPKFEKRHCQIMAKTLCRVDLVDFEHDPDR